MIPNIGLIVGFYVLTRMIQLLSSRSESKLARATAAVTILVTLFALMNLLFVGLETALYDTNLDPTLNIPGMSR
jgi:hypothetical protein